MGSDNSEAGEEDKGKDENEDEELFDRNREELSSSPSSVSNFIYRFVTRL